jgi:3-methyladenine DNA glycosylase AlkD
MEALHRKFAVEAVVHWAKSPNRRRRRAASVALIRGARAKLFFPEITKLSDSVLANGDDMVQKGLGGLLRETAMFDAKHTVPHLCCVFTNELARPHV